MAQFSDKCFWLFSRNTLVLERERWLSLIHFHEIVFVRALSLKLETKGFRETSFYIHFLPSYLNKPSLISKGVSYHLLIGESYQSSDFIFTVVYVHFMNNIYRDRIQKPWIDWWIEPFLLIRTGLDLILTRTDSDHVLLETGFYLILIVELLPCLSLLLQLLEHLEKAFRLITWDCDMMGQGNNE